MSAITRFICDICEEGVDPTNSDFVNADDYGTHMHLGCLQNISALELIQVLDLNDITVGPNGPNMERLIYSKHVQSNRK